MMVRFNKMVGKIVCCHSFRGPQIYLRVLITARYSVLSPKHGFSFLLAY